MRLRSALSLATLLLLLFTVSVWTVPASANLATTDSANQTASGKISAVEGSAFSVDVKDQTMQFHLDENTKVQGKLEVGAQCSVEYRTDGEKNVAVRVVVQSKEG